MQGFFRFNKQINSNSTLKIDVCGHSWGISNIANGNPIETVLIFEKAYQWISWPKKPYFGHQKQWWAPTVHTRNELNRYLGISCKSIGPIYKVLLDS